MEKESQTFQIGTSNLFMTFRIEAATCETADQFSSQNMSILLGVGEKKKTSPVETSSDLILGKYEKKFLKLTVASEQLFYSYRVSRVSLISGRQQMKQYFIFSPHLNPLTFIRGKKNL